MERYRFSEQEQALMESMQVPYAVFQLVDKKIVALVVTDGFCELMGSNDRAKVYEAMDHDTYRNVHPDDIARLGNAAFRFMKEEDRFECVYRLKNPAGSGYLVIHAYGRYIYTETGARLAQIWYANEGVYEEDDRKKTGLNLALSNALHEESILRASYYDYLTGLPSMTYFFELSETGYKAILDRGGVPVLMYMDFSGMKFYNSRHGFAEGDKLLRAFARLLISTFGLENCCRIGADHFAVLSEEAGLEEKLQTILSECRQINDGKALPVHIGVYPAQFENVHISVACDRAKLACKALSGTYEAAFNYYSQDLNDDEENRQYIIENIDRAIREGWIRIRYQAIIRAANGKVCDEEALSRWIDPEKGILTPADFIPALEESKLIYKLDLYVVEQVLQKLKKQEEAGLYLVPQSINLSRMDFDSCDIVEEIRRRVDDAGIDRSMLTIEITESVIGGDFEFMKEQVERFQNLGFRVWMDDFGSGYSSLDVLQSIHFDLIKLDMRFLQQFDSGDEGRIILTEVVRMAMGLGVETVCEGVEQEAQVEFLREIGCTKIQGFYYGKPLLWEEISRLNENNGDLGFEDPNEADYYATLGRVNLYDPGIMNDAGDDSFQRYFDTLPMAIMEVSDDTVQYVRCNKSYREFMERVLRIPSPAKGIEQATSDDPHGAAFLSAVMRCSRDGNRALIDEPIDEKTTIHTFIRRIAVNPVTGAAAVAAAVLAITEEKESAGTSFASITRALSSDYVNLYYVDTETEEFIEYTPDPSRQDLAVERRGADFFHSSAEDAQLIIYKEDRKFFVESFTKENVLRNINEHGTFTLTYRQMMNGTPTYLNMKAVRMRTDSTYIIVGINNVDAQTRQKEAFRRLQAEQTTYSRVTALTQGFICIYTVDPATGHFVEYSAKGKYAGLDIEKEGDDFWDVSRRNSIRLVHPDDVEKFQTSLTLENVMEEIEENGRLSMQYRMYLDDEFRYVMLHAALVEEQDGPQLIIGINDVDDLVKREQDYEYKLAAARSRANLDTLTGIRNKTAYDDMSQSLTKQVEGGQVVKYAILLCRVKDLVQINEAQGHDAGDKLIRATCTNICNTFKHSPVFRVAGDQFAAIAQGHDYDCIDDLIKELEENGRRDNVPIACGMARYDGSGNVASVFERADALCRR